MRYLPDVAAVDGQQAVKQGGKDYVNLVVASKTYHFFRAGSETIN